MLPVANSVLELLDTKDNLDTATDIKITTESIISFQHRVAKPFNTMLKNNILSRFVSQDVSSFSIFDRKKVPAADSLAFYPMERTQWIYWSSTTFVMYCIYGASGSFLLI